MEGSLDLKEIDEAAIIVTKDRPVPHDEGSSLLDHEPTMGVIGHVERGVVEDELAAIPDRHGPVHNNGFVVDDDIRWLPGRVDRFIS